MPSSAVLPPEKAFSIVSKSAGTLTLGIPLMWDRADSCKSCGISYRLEDVSITREEDWPRMARFHAEWSKRICEVILPYLK